MTGKVATHPKVKGQGTLHINKVNYQRLSASLVPLLTCIALINLCDEESFKNNYIKAQFSARLKYGNVPFRCSRHHEIMKHLIARLQL